MKTALHRALYRLSIARRAIKSLARSLARRRFFNHEKSASSGHFGLALSDYTHSTAPNRRYPDLISQRQWKAHLRGEKNPNGLEELQMLAAHCTQQEDAANKVEHQATKSAAAIG